MSTINGDEQLDVVFTALADRTRRDLITQLSAGELTVGQLAAGRPMTMQSVSQHLKVLEHAGLITRTRVAQTRPCRLERDALAEALGWIEIARADWSQRVDRLASHLDKVRDRDGSSEQKPSR